MTDTAEAPITHPEEMRGGFDLQIGRNINLKGSGRLTPARIVRSCARRGGDYGVSTRCKCP